MAHEIADWNINPNKLWFVKVSIVDETYRSVELFLTLADSIADTNRQAFNLLVPYGDNVSVILIAEEGIDLSYFNSDLSYHLKVSGVSSSGVTLKVNPFVDLPDINNGIYRISDLIQKRAIYEINKHTHIQITRDIDIGRHTPLLKVGEVCQIDSTLRSLDILCTITEVITTGTVNSLTNTIGTVEYTDLDYE